jgi:hypothetical protein
MEGPSISIVGGADISAVQCFKLRHRQKAEVTGISTCQCERAIAFHENICAACTTWIVYVCKNTRVITGL